MPEMSKFPSFRVPTGDAFPSGLMMDAASIATGMAFLRGELEKFDEKIHEPLTSTTWPRDLPVKTGGGWVDSVSMFDVSYAFPGGTNKGLIGGETNVLPRIQASTLLVWGENDQDTPLWMGQKMEKEIPDAGLVIFENDDHFAYLRQWPRFNAVVRAFLK